MLQVCYKYWNVLQNVGEVFKYVVSMLKMLKYVLSKYNLLVKYDHIRPHVSFEIGIRSQVFLILQR